MTKRILLTCTVYLLLAACAGFDTETGQTREAATCLTCGGGDDDPGGGPGPIDPPPVPPAPAWSADQRVSNNKAFYGGTLVTLGGTVYLVHLGEHDDSLWVAKYNGSSWTNDSRIPNHRSIGKPSLVVFHNQIHMLTVHADATVWLTRYDEPSNTWLNEVPAPYASGCPPALAVLGDAIQLVGVVPDIGQIWTASLDASGSFSAPTFFTTPGSYGWCPALVVHRATLQMVYQQGNGNGEQRYWLIERHRTATSDWSAPAYVGITSWEAPALVTFNDTLHMIASGYPATDDRVMWSTLQADNTFSEPIALPNQHMYASAASMAVLGNKIVMVHGSSFDDHNPNPYLFFDDPEVELYYSIFQ